MPLHPASQAHRHADDFWTLDTLVPIAKFLHDKYLFDSLDLETHDWVLGAVQEPAELFIPAAEHIAKRWLQDYRWQPRICMLIIYRIRCLVNGDRDEVFTDSPTTSNVLDSAEWNRRVAMCLRDMSYFEEAQVHFEAALRLDCQIWLARGGLAYMYSLNGQHDKALDLYKANLEILDAAYLNTEIWDMLPHDVGSDDIADGYQSIGEEYLALNALAYFEKALDISRKGECLEKFIELRAADKVSESNEQNIQHSKRMGTASDDGLPRDIHAGELPSAILTILG
ncbi:hypothetical protein BO94DRAFT_582901 [Aspergillus sclerotioniger CBS 115572]|uniref:Uncharacterized protein n=1 Tax=Aspergillus sclerotioniger CBS 115572 TaxID=1450535 RepID=A0A317X4F9_9EURO|nr:hypothetical protein BO94DRAFT_582901 [Aspergillus sclerotioniger CBS 115572]PWY93514.1 hypothetical protein BO94DRAFT_582901 [Aspergillus sclerotioniger CBS 115572]